MKSRIELASSKLEDAMSIIDVFCKNTFKDDKELCFGIRLVYEELMTNIFKHATKCNATKVDIELSLDSSNVSMRFSYNGDEFDPTSYKDKRIDEPFSINKKQGGLGLFLVSEFSNQFTYKRKNGLNIVDVKI